MSTPAVVNLYFEDSGAWYTLPDWADYFIRIGKQLTPLECSKGRLVIAVVVPTRAYCAAFVSLGMIVSDAGKREDPTVDAHFEKLLELPPGTPVLFQPSPREVQKGLLQGPEDYNGKLYVRVQVQSKNARTGGGLTHLIEKSRALMVQPARHSGKLPKNLSSKNKRLSNGFVESLLGDADSVQLGLRSKFVCAIVGKKSVLEPEIKQTPLAVYANGNRRAEGQLQDILRVDRFVSAQQSYRSALVPVGSSPPSDDVTSSVEMAVVFDGATGFLKWGSLWPDRHQIIILDRTELHFDDAISAVNNRFFQNRAEIELRMPVNAAPPGGEVLAFQESVP